MRKCDKIVFDTTDKKVKHQVYRAFLAEEIKQKAKAKK